MWLSWQRTEKSGVKVERHIQLGNAAGKEIWVNRYRSPHHNRTVLSLFLFRTGAYLAAGRYPIRQTR